jgi:dihydrofolate reductase
MDQKTMNLELDEESEGPDISLSMIVAVSRNGVIGKNNRLPVRLPADLRRFRIITANKPVIMGRKTHESIGRCLPSRTNIVLSRSDDYKGSTGAIVVHSLIDAYRAANRTNASNGFVIGGGEVFTRFLPLCARLYLTVIDADLEGDTTFPVPIDKLLDWPGKRVQTFEKGVLNPITSSFYILDIPDIKTLAPYFGPKLALIAGKQGA